MPRTRGAIPPATYRVINAGVQGYGPVEEHLFYRDVRRDAPARLVVICAVSRATTPSEAASTGLPPQRSVARAEPADRTLSAIRAIHTVAAARDPARASCCRSRGCASPPCSIGSAGAAEIDPPLRTYLPDAPPEITQRASA
ncbi:MAG: hypothetical protein MZU84_03930 [Sphingobacterium sp.]|nr:hypothetical protein [Sphingobacterium sp.]